ncbi:MAG TPA: FoF1 ATP synthase subunit gamma, partial [Candidatus Saccharibacteria bacterium]|nr:FoF1 ATP synthase subunit gamma [Candidatus Saccharibacteria bacterium]
GAYNSNVLRTLAKELKHDRDNTIETKLILIGKQAAKFASKIEGVNIIGSYDHMPEKPTINDLMPILETVKLAYAGKSEEIVDEEDKNVRMLIEPTTDAVDILYTDYKSSVVQEVAQTRLLPAAFVEVPISADQELAIFEPSPKVVLNAVADRLVDVQLWQAYLESQASEQSARMMAMKTASDNAGDLIDDLTLAMNTARQAAITQELAEIVGGAEAIK